MKWKIALLSTAAAVCCLLLVRYTDFVRKPAQIFGDHDEREEAFRGSVRCALEKLLPGTANAARRRAQLTLDFASRRLFQKIAEYGIDTSQEEVVHFLAQVLHETNYLQYMVESAGGRTWRDAMDSATPSGWDCNAYHHAIISDRDYFNALKQGGLGPNEDPYVRFYRSAYRGRGLVQLTSCYNYLSFFYHKAALRENQTRLAEQVHPRFFYLNSQGGLDEIGWNTFCTEDILQTVQEFPHDGLTLEPIYLMADFEDVVDELSLPCPGVEVPPMDSAEFLVDSATNYWRKCQRGRRYKNYRNQSTAEAVARMSECVHGSSWRLYETFDEETCARRRGLYGRGEGGHQK